MTLSEISGFLRPFLLKGALIGLGVFILAHTSFVWALSVVLEKPFFEIYFWVSPFVASLVLTVVFLITFAFSIINRAGDLGHAFVSVMDAAANWLLLGSREVRQKETINEIQNLIQGIDLHVFRRWGEFWTGLLKGLIGCWMAVWSLALFRNLIGQSNPVVVALLAVLFACLLFRRWVLSTILIFSLGTYFFLAETGQNHMSETGINQFTSSSTTPENSTSSATAENHQSIVSTEISVPGGSVSWTTAFENLPIDNSFKVVILPGSIRIARENGTVSYFDGLLKENGAPFTLRAYCKKREIGVDDWLLPDPNVSPYRLIASITLGGESPSQGRIFPVGRAIVVEQGHSLHFWYNHPIDEEAHRWHTEDSGAFRIKLIPTVSVLH